MMNRLSTLTLLLLLLATTLAGGACAKKADPNQPSEAELAITEYQQGMMLLNNERYEEAIATFRRALALDDNNVLSHYSLALALSRVGRFDEAIAETERVLELKPDYTEVHNIRGMIHNERGEYLKAMESYRLLLESPTYSKPWIAHYNLGFAAANAGNQEEALFYYTKALEMKDDYVQARYQRGLMLQRLGREAEAIREFELVLDVLPESAEVQFSLGKLYFRAGRTVDAKLKFEWVMRYAPGTGYSAEAARYLNIMDTAGH